MKRKCTSKQTECVVTRQSGQDDWSWLCWKIHATWRTADIWYILRSDRQHSGLDRTRPLRYCDVKNWLITIWVCLDISLSSGASHSHEIDIWCGLWDWYGLEKAMVAIHSEAESDSQGTRQRNALKASWAMIVAVFCHSTQCQELYRE